MPKLLIWRWTHQRAYLRRVRVLIASDAVVILSQQHVDWLVSIKLIQQIAPEALTREMLGAIQRLFDFATGVVDEGRCLIVRREQLYACAVVVLWARLGDRCVVVAVLEEEFPLDDDFAVDTVLFENEIRHRRELAAKGGVL